MTDTDERIPDLAAVQRRTVRVLMSAQVVAGLGIGAMLSAGGLLARRLTGSESTAGLATTTVTLGAALLSVPLAALSRRRGRRRGLSAGWLIAAAGAVVVLVSAWTHAFPVLLLGALMFGAGTTANLQSRYAATDLAGDGDRARSLSLVVWSTTVGSVVGPNLVGPGEPVARALGLPPEAGPFVFSTAAFLGGFAVIHTLLRPDPLLAGAARRADAPGSRNLRRAVRAVGRSPGAQLGLLAVVLGHAVMVSVMTMTPVHMSAGGAALSVIGFTISMHVAGMYAFSPLVGRLADRAGRAVAILVGQGVFLLATVLAGTAGHRRWAVMAGLLLLGLGWSCTTVSGSALVTEHIPAEHRSEVQGFSDLLMNLAGACGGAFSGGLVALFGYGGLNAVAAFVALPLAAAAIAFLVRSRGRTGKALT